MNSLVCVKQVPDTTAVKIDPVTNTLIREGVPSILNPFDGFALEMALRLREQAGGTVTLLSMGPPQAAEALRTCLAVGGDRAFLVSGREFGGSDTLATSYILSCAVKALEERTGEHFDVIFCGKQAIDGDTGQVGPELAEHLDFPQITYATDAARENGKLRVRRETAEGYEVLECGLPAVISVTKTPYELRYATVKGIFFSNRAEIPVITPQEMEGKIDLSRAGLKGSPTKVKKSFTPQRSKQCALVDEASPAASGTRLAALLFEANKI
ncbi:electron transfer flavoprotein subunit beta/FixA family protein [uncultured Oscillibacter sp.]|uniref:electron transfer flavoprotein subunit beta/FixA family protein n=1 Tax=uncultured Oscillibacter sp. TaxID=876091 RepID=UPI00263A172C|nr:electron transfer flavoprotein subunit beta/FixA family protein [uncultured Oscillibacter sp.]